MEFSIKLNTIKSGWSIVYNEGLQVIISKKMLLFTLKIHFVLANSEDLDEIPHNAAFHLGLQCLPKYLFMGFPVYKGIMMASHSVSFGLDWLK